MADGVKVDEGSGPKVATDEVGGMQYQRVKPAVGKDGEATDVSSENPMPVGGGVAHDAVDSGSPVKTGARARTALPAAVAQNDRADSISDKFGRQLTTVAPLDERVSSTLNRTDNSAGQLFAALTEGAYVVTAITVVNAHATVGTKVEILDGETVKWKGYAGALGGGFSVADPNGIFVGTKNKKLEGKCATTGADVDINVSAYKIPA